MLLGSDRDDKGGQQWCTGSPPQGWKAASRPPTKVKGAASDLFMDDMILS